MLLSLDEVKQHLRITQDIEDALLLLYVEAAHSHIVNVLNQPIPGIGDSPQECPPPPIKAAALLIIGDMYENREGAGEKDLKQNPAVMRLLYPYRVEIGI